MAKCEHLKQANPRCRSPARGCKNVLQTGQRWVQLRKCLVCGHVGCCDSSPGSTPTQHFKETGHPVMQAFNRRRLEVVLRARGIRVSGLPLRQLIALALCILWTELARSDRFCL